MISKNHTNILAATLAMLCWTPAWANIAGKCYECHTMHNSQGGSTLAQAGTGARWSGGSLGGGSSTDPQDNLLISDCVGCHSSADANTILTVGSNNIPIVYNMSEPTGASTATTSLAGGNFYWVATAGGGDHTKGHNVYGISADDTNHGSGAPGAPAGGCNPCHNKLTLATGTPTGWGTEYGGCRACHLPMHHALTPSSPSTPGLIDKEDGWYRFLGSVMQEAVIDDPSLVTRGVKGIEDSDWEQTVASNDHNVYQGTSIIYRSASPSTSSFTYSSIGELCIGCHQRFHHNAGVSNEMNTDTTLSVDSSALTGVWLRHPSDVKIPSTGEYASYVTYNPIAPVARQNVVAGDANFTTVTHDSDVVNCISCHRPHGSPYMDMLRWSYDNCDALTPNANCGCFVCHTSKDD